MRGQAVIRSKFAVFCRTCALSLFLSGAGWPGVPAAYPPTLLKYNGVKKVD